MKIIPSVNTINYSPKSYSRQWKNNKSEIERRYDKVILITEDDLNIKLTNNIIVVRV